MNKILVILGPTATGKTDLALHLAKKYNGELVSCDSRQVYKGLDIGTGKEPGIKNKELRIKKYDLRWEIDGINVWMLDVVDPNTQYTVSDYVQDAWKVIEDILKMGKLPIVVGGTGLYLRALIEGLPNLSIPVDQKLRGKLEKLSKEELQEKLKQLSSERWENLNQSDRENPRRLLRSIELVLMYGHSNKSQISNLKTQSFNKLRIDPEQSRMGQNYDILKIGLTAPRDILNYRIDQRVLSRLDQGLIQEAEKLHKQGLSFKRMRELGLEYGILADFLEAKVNREEFIKKLQTKIHQYAKRQLTWFKKMKDVDWFDIEKPFDLLTLEKGVDSWYIYQNDQKD